MNLPSIMDTFHPSTSPSFSDDASGLTPEQLHDLSNRDLTPEDYEMLLRLDTPLRRRLSRPQRLLTWMRSVIVMSLPSIFRTVFTARPLRAFPMMPLVSPLSNCTTSTIATSPLRTMRCSFGWILPLRRRLSRPQQLLSWMSTSLVLRMPA